MTEKAKNNIFYERCFRANLKRAHKKLSKPVKWNGMVFESATALGRFLKLDFPQSVSDYARNNKKLNGHIPKYIKKAAFKHENS